MHFAEHDEAAQALERALWIGEPVPVGRIFEIEESHRLVGFVGRGEGAGQGRLAYLSRPDEGDDRKLGRSASVARRWLGRSSIQVVNTMKS